MVDYGAQQNFVDVTGLTVALSIHFVNALRSMLLQNRRRRYFVQWHHNNYRATKSPPCIHAVCFLSVILWAYLFPSFLKDGQSAAEWPSNAYSSECLWLWHGGVTRQDVTRHASVCACAWRLGSYSHGQLTTLNVAHCLFRYWPF